MRSRSKKEIRDADEACIYCFGKPDGVEHMPPRCMFLGKYRLSGMEYAVCNACNHGTRGVDVVAAMMSRISQREDAGARLFQEALRFRNSVIQRAPGVYEEIQSAPNQVEYVADPSGLLRPVVRVRVVGQRLHRHLDVFAAKLGLALYREHCGAPLPAVGLVVSTWYSNAGLTQAYADEMMRIMPSYGTLKQGRQHADGKFRYRFNTDERTIVAALAQFHEGLYISTFVSATPELHGIDRPWPRSTKIRRGELLSMLPPPPVRLWTPGTVAPAA